MHYRVSDAFALTLALILTLTLDGMLQSLAQLLCEMRDVNKSLQFEVDDLKLKLKDANGDIKVCRALLQEHCLDWQFVSNHWITIFLEFLETLKYQGIWLRSGKSQGIKPKVRERSGNLCSEENLIVAQLNKLSYLYFICTAIHFRA